MHYPVVYLLCHYRDLLNINNVFWLSKWKLWHWVGTVEKKRVAFYPSRVPGLKLGLQSVWSLTCSPYVLYVSLLYSNSYHLARMMCTDHWLNFVGNFWPFSHKSICEVGRKLGAQSAFQIIPKVFSEAEVRTVLCRQLELIHVTLASNPWCRLWLGSTSSNPYFMAVTQSPHDLFGLWCRLGYD